MRRFTREFLDDAFRRLATLAPDTVPQWGSMRPPQLFAHLIVTFRYSLGKEPTQPNVGGFLGRYVAGPLILNGIIKRPRNARAPSMYNSQAPAASLDELRQETEEFLRRFDARDLSPPAHQIFGDIGLDGWGKVHVTHMQHHMCQFGV